MIGMIQKVLLSLLEQEGGIALKERVLARAGLPPDARFRINADYADEDVHALLVASQEEAGLSRAELMDRYATHFLDHAQSLFPRFFEMSDGVKDFLIRQPVIHASFAAGLRAAEARQAVVDKFSVQVQEDGALEVSYRSPNRLCDLYQALVRALARRYEEDVAVEVLQCARRCEAEACVMRAYWPSRQRAIGGVACPGTEHGHD
jgi:hypothetical protein